MKTCCEWLKNMLATAGQQGTAVIASKAEYGPPFYIQTRSLTPWQQRTWDRLLCVEPLRTEMDPLFRSESGGPVAVMTGMRVPLSFCPACGTNLVKWAKRHQDDFDKLAEEHQAFADS